MNLHSWCHYQRSHKTPLLVLITESTTKHWFQETGHAGFSQHATGIQKVPVSVLYHVTAVMRLII